MPRGFAAALSWLSSPRLTRGPARAQLPRGSPLRAIRRADARERPCCQTQLSLRGGRGAHSHDAWSPGGDGDARRPSRVCPRKHAAAVSRAATGSAARSHARVSSAADFRFPSKADRTCACARACRHLAHQRWGRHRHRRGGSPTAAPVPSTGLCAHDSAYATVAVAQQTASATSAQLLCIVAGDAGSRAGPAVVGAERLASQKCS